MSPYSLYFHIPYCNQICHYCDFAKTARFDDEGTAAYFKNLVTDFRRWQEIAEFRDRKISSVFFGGGTPSLFTKPYVDVFEKILPFLEVDAEITLEANPKDISSQNLAYWRHLGFNRISIGVQTFDPQGLVSLTRDHSATQALQAIEKALKCFGNVNVDLIYAWPQQTTEVWEKDLDIALGFPVPHLSLYTLTLEKSTPLGKQYLRSGKPIHSDEHQADFFEQARLKLASQGYEHEEVSNWSLPGHSCQHNWTYWDQLDYLAIGVGAHGFFRSSPTDPIGTRYFYSNRLQRFIDKKRAEPILLSDGLIEIDERNSEQALLEKISLGCRTKRGLDIKNFEQVYKKSFSPSPNILEGQKIGQIIKANEFYFLDSQQWFREGAWALEFFNSF